MANFLLPEAAFQWMERELRKGVTIVEFGSGEGTNRLCLRWRVFSVEHDAAYLGRTESTYIHAPIRDGWYDSEVLAEQLPKSYEFLLIDGPPGRIGRLGILDHLHLLDLSVPILIDDVHRAAEARLCARLEEVTGRSARTISERRRAFSVV